MDNVGSATTPHTQCQVLATCILLWILCGLHQLLFSNTTCLAPTFLLAVIHLKIKIFLFSGKNRFCGWGLLQLPAWIVEGIWKRSFFLPPLSREIFLFPQSFMFYFEFASSWLFWCPIPSKFSRLHPAVYLCQSRHPIWLILLPHPTVSCTALCQSNHT